MSEGRLRPAVWAAAYAGPTLLMAAAVAASPVVAERLGVPLVVGWFACGSAMFAAMAAAGVLLLRREGRLRDWRDRVRLRRFDRAAARAGLRTLAWASLAAAGVLAALWAAGVAGRLPPPTLDVPNRVWWLPLVWLPYYLLNVGCEEFYWRGVLLPREEATLGRRAWLLNGLGVTAFHLPLGWPLTLVVNPYLVAMARAAQRSGNLWASLLLHGSLNAAAFAAAWAGVV